MFCRSQHLKLFLITLFLFGMTRVYKRCDYNKSDLYDIRAIIFEFHEDSLVEICDWNLALDHMLCNLSFRRLIFCFTFLDLWTLFRLIIIDCG
jgi:hypothetical protein